MKTTGRPCDSASCCANSSSVRVPSTLTSCAAIGVNSERVDSSAARWNIRSTSNSAITRSSSALSVIDPVISRSTFFAISGSNREMSRVTMRRSPRSARRSMRPWPISPPAPVMMTTGLRIDTQDEHLQRRKRQHQRRKNRQRRRHEAERGADEMIHPFGFQWVEPLTGQETADESAKVGGIVDAGHDQAKDEDRDRVVHGLRSDETAAAAPAVMDERAEQPEDWR